MLRILVDSREQHPLTFPNLPVTTERVTLSCGDYSLPGWEDRVCLERKGSLDELVGNLCQDRERFEKELARSRNMELFAVVVEGSYVDLIGGRYRSQMKAKAVIASLAAFTIRYKVPFYFVESRQGAEMLIYSLLSKFLYEIERRWKRAQG